jgi:hypothetical protein
LQEAGKGGLADTDDSFNGYVHAVTPRVMGWSKDTIKILDLRFWIFDWLMEEW